MQQTVPIILVPPPPAPDLSRAMRLLWFGLALACLSVLIVAASLTPDPKGESTHAQLGLASCQFLARTGLPCPTCGMTTSFAWFVRGNLLASFWVQPMGLALGTMTSLTFWLALYMAISAKPALRLATNVSPEKWVFPLMGLAIFAWGWKIFVHLRGIDGWR